MNRLYRLGGMILLFLLLANGISASGSQGSVPLSTPQTVVSPPCAPFGSGTLYSGLADRWPTEADLVYASNEGGESPLEPELQRMLASAATDEFVRVVVHLAPPARVQIEGLDGSGTVEARAQLVSSLRAVAEESQSSLRAYLERERINGGVSSYQPFWITNVIAVQARPSVVWTLATRPSVVGVTLDRRRRWVGGVDPTGRSRSLPIEDTEWNVHRIRADEVWSSLEISGTGAVVAGMDTGADWLHPALQANYRGYNPHGPANHTYSWYDATDGGALYPVDGHGHGSHTLGTVVGRGGVGIAPGASWIGVRVLDSQGYGYDSWIHAGFQWILAPGGDASRAPDVVNCSWGASSGSLTTFQDDLRVVRAAGILPVFSSGNDGPAEGTVSSPASLPEAVAVGAVDEYDEVATFSSRGPSPWGEIRPHVVAPGVNVRSSVPGGAYAMMNGTSMAAPHVSGVAALLRAVSPTVSITRTTHVITSTALPLGEDVPNNDTGWGRVDAFAAVTALARSGFIAGTVKEAGEDLPIEGARVAASPHGGQASGNALTDARGVYSLALSPGMYDVTISAFGYESATASGVRVLTNTVTSQNASLVAEPTGKLDARVLDASNGNPVTATVTVLDTPYEVTTHTHAFDLPSGTYTLRARRLGYRVVTSTVVVSAGEASSAVLRLPEAPSLLLVDSGRWYYQSQIDYFRQALDDLSYAYDEWAISRLPDDIPSVSDVRGYDILVWSAPRDGPGYIGAGDVITTYLDGGGRLLLSGQDVGFWDGGGSGTTWSSYYRDYLKTQFADDDAPTRILDGIGGDILAGMAITIAGAGGAANQDYPDVVSVVDTDAAAPVLAYRDDGCGGVRVGTCVDYRVLYLSFGFEAINERAARRSVMESALEWLSAAPPTAGLELDPPFQLRVGSAGSLITHTVRVRHVGQRGSDDTIDLALEGISWPTELSHSSLTLSPCTSATVAISVTVPLTAAWHVRDVVTLTAHSSLSPSLSVSATLASKAPAPVLLVDDDRWYDQQATYKAAMEEAGVPYDLWVNSPPMRGGHEPGPSFEILDQYPMVAWWTGYDWYAPITDDEATSLEAYLDSGGRLFLSSQDLLYYHDESPFRRTHLGVLTYTQDVTPTEVTGVSENPVGGGLGPWSLRYPAGYQNWSDGVVPTPGTGVTFRDERRRATALTRRAGDQATLFLSFPFEALPADVRPDVMEAALGWLSWLGRTTFEAEPRSVTSGSTVSYTITVRNDGPEPVTASVSNTLPAELAFDDGTIVGPGIYDPIDGRLSWRGMVKPYQPVVLAYRARVLTGTPPAEIVVNPVRISLEDHMIGFSRGAEVGVERPDLSSSTFGCAPAVVPPGGVVTCSLVIINGGTGDAPSASARMHPPGGMTPVTDSLLTMEAEGEWSLTADGIDWTGPLPAGTRATLTFQLQVPREPIGRTLYGVAFLDDGVGGRWERPAWLEIRPRQAYFPVVMKQDR
jgi:uncharacterized repeat protein (TIGR01451 family)